MTEDFLNEGQDRLFGDGHMRAAVFTAVGLGLTVLMLCLVVFRVDAARLGDADCNGTVNSIDALLILQHDAGLTDFFVAPDCVGKADINQDGAVNAIDAALVLQHVAGLITLPTPFGTGDDVPTPVT